ncbi:MAG: hypothetical protein AAGL17_08250 [Cyanobacteria bacterium J06576_12]
MTDAFVGTTPKNVEQTVLEETINRYKNGNTWAFLRWPHEVKLLPVDDSVDLTCPEGQIFSADFELRWQKQKGVYDVLLLADMSLLAKEKNALETLGLEELEGDWNFKDLEAHFYPPTEARFPKGLAYAKKDAPAKLDIGQRYFIDAQTACVQFIALRVA